MKLTCLLTLLGVILSSLAFGFETTGEYIVKLKSKNFPQHTQAFSQFFEQQGVEVTSVIPSLNLIVVEPRAGIASLQTVLETLGGAEYIEPNYIIDINNTGLAPQKYPRESHGKNWTHAQINSPAAWDVTTGSRDIITAISDTGILAIHQDLQANIMHSQGESGKDADGKNKAKNKKDDDGNGYIDDTWGWNFDGNSNSPRDEHYHGTHVAGIAAAVGNNGKGVVGVTWTTSLMSVRMFTRDGRGSTERGIQTIVYAASNGAKVVNCSWGGGGYSKALWEAIEFAKSKGTLIVAAAGNDTNNNDKNPFYPASYDNENLITVAASDSSEGVAFFSNYGKSSVDLAAPGHNIYSTWNPFRETVYRDYYYTISGTSMAAPFVTGAVSLVYSANPNLGWREVKDILLSTARKHPKWKDKVSSDGILDVAAAVKKAKALSFVTDSRH